MYEARPVFTALHESPAMQLPLDKLVLTDSPRTAGLDAEHAQRLAETGAELPAIIVHRSTMRVLDGAHRCAAAHLRGETSIYARLCDEDEDNAFVIAVGANAAHGLPLPLADRKRAAERILTTHSGWSNHTIAAVSGLSDKTVGTLRTGCDRPQAATRVGRDGRVRPLDCSEGRRRAAEFLAQHPHASLREIARSAEISPGTARDVRNRVQRGKAAFPEPRSSLNRAQHDNGAAPAATESPATALTRLRNDPSLRFNEPGRMLLQLLEAHRPGGGRLVALAENVPLHCAAVVADLAAQCGQSWLACSERLRERLRSST